MINFKKVNIIIKNDNEKLGAITFLKKMTGLPIDGKNLDGPMVGVWRGGYPCRSNHIVAVETYYALNDEKIIPFNKIHTLFLIK